jgi:hypothetical protein
MEVQSLLAVPAERSKLSVVGSSSEQPASDLVMRKLLMSLAAASVVAIVAPLTNGMALAQADVDVRVGPPSVKIEEPRRPDVVIEEPRRPGVVIEETKGSKRDCVTRSQTETGNGVTVTEKERDCR